jgi:hypothetical protein
LLDVLFVTLCGVIAGTEGWTDIHEYADGHHDWFKKQGFLIDGKTLRGSYSREDRQATIHMVNAFACANQLVLGQLKTADKSNEISAIPELIALLDIKGVFLWMAPYCLNLYC